MAGGMLRATERMGARVTTVATATSETATTSGNKLMSSIIAASDAVAMSHPLRSANPSVPGEAGVDP